MKKVLCVIGILLIVGCSAAGVREDIAEHTDKPEPAPAEIAGDTVKEGIVSGTAEDDVKTTSKDGAEARELSEAEYNEFASIGKATMVAHQMYQDYFTKKAADGTKNITLLDRVIALLDSLIPRLEKLLVKYPDSMEIQEIFKQVTEDRRGLLFEK